MPPPTAGDVEVADRAANSAAPMLAGLIGALVGVVGVNTSSVRWPGPTLAALVLAVLSLLVSMQTWMFGQSFRVPFSEVEEQVTGLPGDSPEQLRARQRQTFAKLNEEYRGWVRRSRWSFQVGVSLFLVGLALVVLPDTGAAGATWRWAAAAVTVTVAVAGAIVIPYREHRETLFGRELTQSSPRCGPFPCHRR